MIDPEEHHHDHHDAEVVVMTKQLKAPTISLFNRREDGAVSIEFSHYAVGLRHAPYLRQHMTVIAESTSGHRVCKEMAVQIDSAETTTNTVTTRGDMVQSDQSLDVSTDNGWRQEEEQKDAVGTTVEMIDLTEEGAAPTAIATSFEFEDLKKGQLYRFQIHFHLCGGIDAGGLSVESEWTDPWILMLPPTPIFTRFRAFDQTVWLHYGCPGYHPPGDHRLQYEVRGNHSKSESKKTEIDNIKIEQLENGEEYTFSVRAFNEAGYSEWSYPPIRLTPLEMPSKPEQLRTTPNAEDGSI